MPSEPQQHKDQSLSTKAIIITKSKPVLATQHFGNLPITTGGEKNTIINEKQSPTHTIQPLRNQNRKYHDKKQHA